MITLSCFKYLQLFSDSLLLWSLTMSGKPEISDLESLFSGLTFLLFLHIKDFCLLQGKMISIQHASKKAEALCLCGSTFFAEQHISQAMVKTLITKKK